MSKMKHVSNTRRSFTESILGSSGAVQTRTNVSEVMSRASSAFPDNQYANRYTSSAYRLYRSWKVVGRTRTPILSRRGGKVTRNGAERQDSLPARRLHK